MAPKRRNAGRAITAGYSAICLVLVIIVIARYEAIANYSEPLCKVRGCRARSSLAMTGGDILHFPHLRVTKTGFTRLNATSVTFLESLYTGYFHRKIIPAMAGDKVQHYG